MDDAELDGPRDQTISTCACQHWTPSIAKPVSLRADRLDGCILPALISGFWAATTEDWAMLIWAKTS